MFEFLNEIFPQCWIGRGGQHGFAKSITWPYPFGILFMGFNKLIHLQRNISKYRIRISNCSWISFSISMWRDHISLERLSKYNLLMCSWNLSSPYFFTACRLYFWIKKWKSASWPCGLIFVDHHSSVVDRNATLVFASILCSLTVSTVGMEITFFFSVGLYCWKSFHLVSWYTTLTYILVRRAIRSEVSDQYVIKIPFFRYPF